MSLYNQVRPGRFFEVKGQDKTIQIIRDNIKSGHLPNAMLYVGTRGVGKTTIAKITAKTINCTNLSPDGECCDCCASCQAIKNGNSMDVLELDAASNNGVDHIRSIIDSLQYKPIGKMRIIILDEVHMLSNSAFNALLKIMEEPPEYVMFILCTTEVHKIPATILSRCRKFVFEPISEDKIIEKLRQINTAFSLTAEEDALLLIARAAKGSLRDAESIYENFLDVENKYLSASYVRELLGFSDDEKVFEILNAIVDREPTQAFFVINQTQYCGGNLVYLLEKCFRVLMDVICIQACGDISAIHADKVYLDAVSKLAFSASMERLIEIADAFRKAYEYKSANLEFALQSMILSLICNQTSVSSLIHRMEIMEKQLSKINGSATCIDMASIHFTNSQTEDTKPLIHGVLDSQAPDLSEEEAIWEHTQQALSERMSVETGGGDKPKEITTAASVKDDGFTSLNTEQIKELQALGFDVDTAHSPRQSNASVSVKTDTDSNEDSSSDEESAPPKEKSRPDMFFGSFARLFDGF